MKQHNTAHPLCALINDHFSNNLWSYLVVLVVYVSILIACMGAFHPHQIPQRDISRRRTTGIVKQFID